MIDLIFERAGEMIVIRISGHNVLFGNTSYGAQMATIEGLKLDYHGSIKEFPDLTDNPQWREETIKRWKEKIVSLDNEPAISQYLQDDLKKHHYIIKSIIKGGFRPITF